MAKRITIGSRAVAVAIVAEVLKASHPGGNVAANDDDLAAWADNVVTMAWDVEYKPTAERLVLTIDAGITGPDRNRQTPEDQAVPQ